MDRIIERDEFLRVIETSLGEVEDSISTSYFYLMMYRLTKKYGTTDGIQVRCSYERILTSPLFNDSSIDADLKQRLWTNGIKFSEDPMSGISDRDTRRLLMVIHEWTNTQDIINEIDKKRKSGEFGMAPTDLFIENLTSNKEYDECVRVLGSSNIAYMTIWYLRKSNDYYASFQEKDTSYHAIFEEDEIHDIEQDIKDLLDVSVLPVTIVDDLIHLGYSLYKDGFKCLEFNDMIPTLKYITDTQYHAITAAFLVYMAETYNMKINTTYDEMFCKQYLVYRGSEYCLAEDLLMNKDDLYRPIMYYVTNSDGRLLYIRNIRDSYTYNYFREEEIELLLTGSMDVNIHKWTPSDESAIKSGCAFGSDKVRYSDYVNYLDEESDEDVEKYPMVKPLFSCIESEECLVSIVNAINKYNAEKSRTVATKYVTVRDMLCMIDKDGDEEVLRIGYIQADGANTYTGRVKEDVFVSSMNEDSEELISRICFPLTRNLNNSLYQLRYVYNIGSEARRALTDFINETDSLDTDIWCPYEEDEDGSIKKTFSRAEKFLYYVCSIYMRKGIYMQLSESLTGSLAEFKTALYKSVYTVSEVLPEFLKSFASSGYGELITAELLDAYGNLNSKYIREYNGEMIFDVRNELFGIMTMDK